MNKLQLVLTYSHYKKNLRKERWAMVQGGGGKGGGGEKGLEEKKRD